MTKTKVEVLVSKLTNNYIFSKTVVKLTPTPNTVVEADNTKVCLPPNTLVDLRTLSLFYEGTCT